MKIYYTIGEFAQTGATGLKVETITEVGWYTSDESSIIDYIGVLRDPKIVEIFKSLLKSPGINLYECTTFHAILNDKVCYIPESESERLTRIPYRKICDNDLDELRKRRETIEKYATGPLRTEALQLIDQ